MDFSTESYFPVILVGIILFLISRFSSGNYSFWKKRGIPFEESNFFLDFFPSRKGKTVQEIQVERRNRYGRVYGYYEQNRPILSISDPVLLKDILVKDFKYLTSRRDVQTLDQFSSRFLTNLLFDEWKRVRTLITPTFTTGKLKKLLPLFEECSNTLVKNFKNEKNKNNVEIRRFFQAFTLDVIATSAFSTKLDSYNSPNNTFVQAAKNLFKNCSWLKISLINFLVFIFGARSLKLFLVLSELTFFEKAALEVVNRRKRHEDGRSDFLQLLLNASTECEENAKCDNDDFSVMSDIYKAKLKNDKIVSKKLSVEEIVAQCGIFLIAGHHTTAMVLSFAIYLLSVHQDVQEKAFQEIKDILDENKGVLNSEGLQKMTYLENIISETLRMYPPAPILERITDVNYQLGSTGWIIPKGVKIIVPIYALQRDPDFFPNPDSFDPSRFDGSNVSQMTPYSFLPFGDGPRNCVAKRFALMEVKVCLVKLLASFHVKTCLETKIPLEFHNGRHILFFTNLLPKDIKVNMVVRTENPYKA